MSKAESIKARIKQVAVKENKPFDYLLMHYFIERLLYRISISNHADNFILKGGLFLYTILGNDARATKDVDLLARQINNTLEDLQKIFIDICSIQCDDAVIFDTSSIFTERIKEFAEYEGVRVKVIGYLDRTRHILQLDIGFGDVIVPKIKEMEYPSILDMDRVSIKTYSIESVIAEKFEAMIYLSEANSRMKDFYDIYSLCKEFDFDGRVLYEAVLQTFAKRVTPTPIAPTVFSEEFPNMKDKQTQWKAFQRRVKSASSLEFTVVIYVIKLFLQPIYYCVLEEREFFGQWNCKSGEWCSGRNNEEVI